MSDSNRRKRMRRVKCLIFAAILLLIVVPVSLCVYFELRIGKLEKEVIRLQTGLEGIQANKEQEEAFAGEDFQEEALEQPEDVSEEDSIRRWETMEDAVPEQNPYGGFGIRKVYLTFDDGPSLYTDQILDILKEYDVKATFFVVAKGKEPYEDAYRRIVEEGHTLGMHSYSHVYREIYRSRESFVRDVNRLQDYLYEVTGTHPEVYRFPGGSSNRVSTVKMSELEDYLAELGLEWYDWNISSGDATGHISKSQIVWNCTRNLDKFQDAMILMHDAADKRSTVEALPEIIETILQMEDTVIVPITKDTVPIQHGWTGTAVQGYRKNE